MVVDGRDLTVQGGMGGGRASSGRGDGAVVAVGRAADLAHLVPSCDRSNGGAAHLLPPMGMRNQLLSGCLLLWEGGLLRRIR
mmetsp:Transcript_39441/g.72761  ORF Transcript_39441/g.72761 Transcript_39441/m.72761 type:complete len:82 (+) Transcript_39441:1760-2005(+)